MQEDNFFLITQYIAVWGWHLTGMIFLTGAAIMLNENLAISLAFFLLMGGCELISLFRKKKLEDEI